MIGTALSIHVINVSNESSHLETPLKITKIKPTRLGVLPPRYRVSPRYPSPRYPERRQIVHHPACALVRGVWESADAEQVLGMLLAPSRLQVRLCRRCQPLGAAGVGLNEAMRDHGWAADVQGAARTALGLA